MLDQALQALLIVAVVGAGLLGGLFFVFSNTVMRAFDRLPAGGAVASMQRINEVILNPLFFLALFGRAMARLPRSVDAVESRTHHRLLVGISRPCAQRGRLRSACGRDRSGP